MACHAVARTPRCMLWLDMTEEGTLDNCLIARLTPTRSSPFSPLQRAQQKVSTGLENCYHAGWAGNNRPEEDEGVPSNKPFRTNKHTPATLEEMPPRLPWKLCEVINDQHQVYKQGFQLTDALYHTSGNLNVLNYNYWTGRHHTRQLQVKVQQIEPTLHWRLATKMEWVTARRGA
jgi:hypothetical protein